MTAVTFRPLHRQARARTLWKLLALASLLMFGLSITPMAAFPAESPLPVVRVGVYDNAPLLSMGPQGRPQGLFADVLHEVARQAGWKLEYTEGRWQDLYNALREGQLDLIPAVAFSEARLKDMDFSSRPLMLNWGQVFARRGNAITDLTALRNKRVALQEKDTHAEAFTALMNSFGLTFVPVDAVYHEILDIVERGGAEAGVVNRIYGATHGPEHDLQPTPIIFNPIQMRFAVTKGDPKSLLPKLDQVVATLLEGENTVYHQSLHHWLGASAQQNIPRWLLYVLPALVGTACLFLGLTMLLRRQVSRSTAVLAAKNALLANEVFERRNAEERLRRESAFNKAQAAIARAITAYGISIPAVSAKIYDQAMAGTGSQSGFVASIDPLTGDMHSHTLTPMMQGGRCAIPHATIVFHKGSQGYTGLWGHALNTRQGFFTNSPSAHQASQGVPDGHTPLEQFLAVPAVIGTEPVGLIALANPGRDYTAEDLAMVASLADLYAMAISRIRNVEALAQAKEAAEQASMVKSSFLAVMSHEIRTPLNGVMGMLQLMHTTHLNAEQQEYVGAALHTSGILLRLLSDILDISRIEADKLPIAHAVFSLEEVVQPVVELFEHEARRKGLSFVVHRDPAVPPRFWGDAGRVRQVLYNLVSNAVKFTAHGGVRLDIYTTPGLPRRHAPAPSHGPSHASPQAERALLHLVVTDTGMGIDDAMLDLVFGVFTQVEEVYTRKSGGSGLGLAIVKRLTLLMGGSLCVVNGGDAGEGSDDAGGGTQMHLALPLEIASADQPQVVMPSGMCGLDTLPPPVDDKAAPTEPSRLLAQCTVLVVEDEQVNRLAASRFLKKLGCSVREASNGHEALELLAKERVDVVLMDIQMPEMDGVETTRRLRALPPETLNRSVPIVALTAHAMAGDCERFLAAGMDAYLAKPVDMAILEAMLLRVLQPPQGPGASTGARGPAH